MNLPQTLEAIEAEFEKKIVEEFAVRIGCDYTGDSAFECNFLRKECLAFLKSSLLRALSTAREGTRGKRKPEFSFNGGSGEVDNVVGYNEALAEVENKWTTLLAKL